MYEILVWISNVVVVLAAIFFIGFEKLESDRK